MADHPKKRIVSDLLKIDFAEIVRMVRGFEKTSEHSLDDLLLTNEIDLFDAMEGLCEIMNCLPPSHDRDELMRRIMKVNSSMSVVSMLNYQIAFKVVKQETAHEGAKTAGDRSKDITRKVALEKRGRDGTALTPSQLVPHVQKERLANGLSELKENGAAKTISRHLENFPH